MYLLPSLNIVYLHLPYCTFEADLVNLRMTCSWALTRLQTMEAKQKLFLDLNPSIFLGLPSFFNGK